MHEYLSQSRLESTGERCPRCGWPMYDDPKDGCTRDNCSMRPLPPLRDDALPFVTSERFRVEKAAHHVGYVIYWGAIHFCEVFGAREYADAQCALLNRTLDDPQYVDLLREIRGGD